MPSVYSVRQRPKLKARLRLKCNNTHLLYALLDFVLLHLLVLFRLLRIPLQIFGGEFQVEQVICE